MDEDYQSIRRRQAEERRKKRDEERQKRRAKLGMTTRLKPSVVVGGDRKKDKASSPASPISRKRIRVNSNRIEKLKEDKRAEDGLRLMEQMYGVQYLKSDELFNESPVKSSAKQSTKTVLDDISPSPLTEDLSDWNVPVKSVARSSSESRHDNARSIKAKSAQGWQMSSSVYTHSQIKSPVNLRPNLFSNRDSSSDEDLVALAQKLEKKKKLSPSQRMNASLKSKTSAKKQGQEKGFSIIGKEIGDNDAGSDDYLTKSVQKDDTRRRRDANCNRSNEEKDIVDHERKREARKKKPQSDSESDVEDLVSQ